MANQGRRTDWAAILDYGQALTNCHTDFLGDWYRDPWGWVELDWIVDGRVEILSTRLNSTGVRQATRLDVIKENFAIRPAIVMDPVDRLIYQSLVDLLSRKLIGSLPSFVFGWRLDVKKPKRGEYTPNDAEWGRYRIHLAELAPLKAALRTDIVSCFQSIRVDLISDTVSSVAGTGVATERLLDLLRGWDGIHGRGGLPQRSAASAVLANLYLMPLDDVLKKLGAARSPFYPNGLASRWMDDIWLFASNAPRVRKAQMSLMQEMRQLGLEMNIGKTDVFEGDAVATEAQRIEHSAVDAALAEPRDPDSAVPLNELIDRLLEQPEHADRTSVRFVTTRMRNKKLFGRVDDFVSSADRMPHCADLLARLFRDSGAWRSLDEWYVNYASSQWAAEWSIAQFGTMFSSKGSGFESVRNYLASRLTTSTAPLEIVSLAAQRLAAWDRTLALDSIREAAPKHNSPHARRALALASGNAREARFRVRQLLSEFEENQVTLSFLEDSNFKSVKPRADFQ
jgi:hypothetical protein